LSVILMSKDEKKESKIERRPFIGGNWKSNGNRKSVEALVSGLNKASFTGVDVAVAPTHIYLDYVQKNLNKDFIIAAQNSSLTGDGAFTGEISATSLKDFGIEWVILGHSERRAKYHENDLVVGTKVNIAQKAGLSVIACIGETKEERLDNQTQSVTQRQLKAIAENVVDWSHMVIAYEPVWAIGTGLSATPEQAEEVHHSLRKWISENVKETVSQQIRIIYGGSVSAQNCNSLIVQKNIDGFLVGGASLKSDDFTTIIGSPAARQQQQQQQTQTK